MTMLLLRCTPLLASLSLLAVGCRARAEAGSARVREEASPPALPMIATLASDATEPTRGGSACPEGMARIPGGTYRMQKAMRRTTSVQAFCIDITEVTVAAYKACVHEGKCSPECLSIGQCSAVPTRAEWGDPEESQRASHFCNGDRDDRQDHPVNCVSWEESATYCAARGKRLPRPEEWEWAARRADPRMAYPWGNDPPARQLCWSPKANRHEGTCAVESHPQDRTPQGVLDMGGNVAEWVLAKASAGPRERIAFGASWWSMDDGYMRGALGGVEVPSARNETVGFRCAKDAG